MKAPARYDRAGSLREGLYVRGQIRRRISLEDKMDANAIVSIISTVGFPIVACGALFWFINRQQESHREEMKSLEKSLNENTTILMQLKEVMNFIIEEIKKND